MRSSSIFYFLLGILYFLALCQLQLALADLTVSHHGHHVSIVNEPSIKAAAEVPSGGLVGGSRRFITAELSYLALTQNVPGDFVETGVFNGGTAAVMLKVLAEFDPNMERKFYACDSFEGLPAPVEEDNGARELSVDGKPIVSTFTGAAGTFACDINCFTGNLKGVGVWDENRIVLVKGWFNESLPKIAVKKISFLRLDGDLYVSTRDGLKYLYDKVSPGGYIYVDDYGSFAGCAQAVDEFRKARGITAKMHSVTEAWNENNLQVPLDTTLHKFEAVWWQKPLEGEGGDSGEGAPAVPAGGGDDDAPASTSHHHHRHLGPKPTMSSHEQRHHHRTEV